MTFDYYLHPVLPSSCTSFFVYTFDGTRTVQLFGVIWLIFWSPTKIILTRFYLKVRPWNKLYMTVDRFAFGFSCSWVFFSLPGLCLAPWWNWFKNVDLRRTPVRDSLEVQTPHLVYYIIEPVGALSRTNCVGMRELSVWSLARKQMQK